MPDALITDAGRSILDYGVIGAICLILMGVIWFREKQHRTDLTKEQDSHQKTREAQLDEVRKMAALGETMRDQMRSVVATMEMLAEIIKDRARP